MKVSGLVALVSLALLSPVFAADATSPVDAAQRNAPFAPSATIQPEKKTLPSAAGVQEKRFEKPTVSTGRAPIDGQRSAIDLKESRPKAVTEKNSSRPEAEAQPKSVFNQQTAAIVPADETKKPPVVAKYQDSLSAASASNMARFPALGSATTAKINRFVFRKNAPDAAAPTADSPVVPAGGGSAIRP